MQSTPAADQNGTAEGGSSVAVTNEEAAEGVQPPAKKPKTEVSLSSCYPLSCTVPSSLHAALMVIIHG